MKLASQDEVTKVDPDFGQMVVYAGRPRRETDF
jgi:hypothetical protein